MVLHLPLRSSKGRHVKDTLRVVDLQASVAISMAKTRLDAMGVSCSSMCCLIILLSSYGSSQLGDCQGPAGQQMPLGCRFSETSILLLCRLAPSRAHSLAACALCTSAGQRRLSERAVIIPQTSKAYICTQPPCHNAARLPTQTAAHKK